MSSCPEIFFCDFSDKQQSAGVCRDCAMWSPLECSAYLTTAEGQASCISTCFEPCLVDQLLTDPCPSSSSGEAHFCTFIDDDTNPNGSCMNCHSHLIKSPIDCRDDLECHYRFQENKAAHLSVLHHAMKLFHVRRIHFVHLMT
eukprot:scaffold8976_cov60-Attheya_sp.AAC.2